MLYPEKCSRNHPQSVVGNIQEEVEGLVKELVQQLGTVSLWPHDKTEWLPLSWIMLNDQLIKLDW